jgi:DNA-binding HxlR family transcriptional regulator
METQTFVEQRNITPDTCAVSAAVDIIGDRWSLLILRDVFFGVRRFEDFHSGLGISRSVLTARLASLVEAGVLRRKPYQAEADRTRFEYRPTRAGVELLPSVVALMRWGARNAMNSPPAMSTRHADCGAEVDAVLRCRAGHVVAPSEMETHTLGRAQIAGSK